MVWALLGALSISAAGAAVYDTAVPVGDYSGNRSVGSGLAYTGGWSGFKISWAITPNFSGNYWKYQYTLDSGKDPQISHWILDLSDDCIGTDGGQAAGEECVVRLSPEGKTEFKSFSESGGNTLPATIGGVKFDFGPAGEDLDITISFLSLRSPVWGDFWAKGGSGSTAYNLGLTDHSSTNKMDFIARPNGEGGPPQEVPEPSTYIMFAAGFGLLGFARRRMK